MLDLERKASSLEVLRKNSFKEKQL